MITLLLTLLQIEALNEEKKRLSSDIAEIQNRMRDELEIQQLQHFKVKTNKLKLQSQAQRVALYFKSAVCI